MTRRIALLLIALAVLLPGAIGLAQGGDPDAAIDLAINALGQQLGVSLTRAQLTGWNWQRTSWPDASMACPAPGQVYAQVVTQGYVITLEYRGSSYELHVDPASGAVVMCGSAAQITPAATLPGAAPTAVPDAPAATTPLATPAGATLAAPGDPEALLDLALGGLGAHLNTTITRADLADWDWQEIIWTDASLGCPVEGQVYAQVMTRGYAFTLVFLGTSYEVRVTEVGDSVLLCESATAEVVPADSTAQATTPAQRYTPDVVIDLVLAYLSDQLGEEISRENTRWEWEEQRWSDASLGCPVEGETYEPVESGGYVFRVGHFEADYEVHVAITGARGIAPCNAEGQFLFPAGLPDLDTQDGTDDVAALATEEAAGAPTVQLVYTGPDGEIYLAAVDDMPGEALTDNVTVEEQILPRFDHSYGSYRWSPDGTQLAFVDGQEQALLALEIPGGEAFSLAENLTFLYPPAWSPDGSEVAYITPTDATNNNNRVMAIYAVPAPGSGDEPSPRLIATFEQGVGCGGGSSDPSDALRGQEVGYMGNTLAFSWLPQDRFLFSNICTGLGLTLLETTSGEATPIDPPLARAALSPDGAQIAGITLGEMMQPEELVVLTLNGGETQTVSLEFAPDRVAWAADGQSLYVASAELIETFGDPSGSPTAIVNDVSLWQVDLATGEAEELFRQEGHSIGTMSAGPDGGLAFTFIEDSSALVEAVESGADEAAQREVAPTTRLFFVDAEGQVSELGEGGRPAFQPTTDEAVG